MNKLNFDEATEERLNAIAERCDDEAKAHSEYCTENEDYAGPLFYSDWEIDVSHVEPETAEVIARFKAQAGKDWRNELKSYCDLQFTHGIHCVTDEISSFSLGEIELQPSDELLAELDKLTDEELVYVQRQTSECYVKDGKYCRGWLYLNHDYDRWSLVLDVERLAEAVASLEVDSERA